MADGVYCSVYLYSKQILSFGFARQYIAVGVKISRLEKKTF